MYRTAPPLTFLALVGVFVATNALAQTGTGQLVDSFGPWSANGAFTEITSSNTLPIYGNAIAGDRLGRVLVLSRWQVDTQPDRDCALTRHLPDARLLDMDMSGSFEGTQRITSGAGADYNDDCTALATDPVNRPVIAGYSQTDTVISGFLARMDADETGYDNTFSTDGRILLSDIISWAGVETRLHDVTTLPTRRVLSCGQVTRGGDRDMLVLRTEANGSLDNSFSSNGWIEIDFSSTGTSMDTCSRVLLLPDGKMLVAGNVDDAQGNPAIGVARLNASGSLDTSFSSDGKRIISSTTVLTTTTFADLAWDKANARILIAANLNTGGSRSGQVIALDATGDLDTGFNDTGRRVVRFSDFAGQFGASREAGDTRLGKILARDDGRIYLAGTHTNSIVNAVAYGDTDVALARLRADGSDDEGSDGFSGDGVSFRAFPDLGHSDVDPDNGDPPVMRVDDTLKDAIFHRGDLLILSDTERHPAGNYSHGSFSQGPVAPVIAKVAADGLFHNEFEYDGLPEPTTLIPIIPVPAGYGNYCSVLDPSNPAAYGLLPQGAGSDPCQQFLDSNPNLQVRRSGLWSINGANQVLATCSGGFIWLEQGNGATPINASFAATAGRTGCVFTISPKALPVWDRPYTGDHTAWSGQSFNHNPYGRWNDGVGVDVGDFGQNPVSGHALAHNIDRNGIQKCTGASGHPVLDGVDEPAMDLPFDDVRFITSVAPGRVAQAVPRFVLRYTPVGNDPWQREVFIRHMIGSGRYTEQFTTYYAHQINTMVRRGEIVDSGDALGISGSTGASSGVHLHLGVLRHRNLSYRQSFEPGYAQTGFDVGRTPGTFSPFGWNAPAGFDPWAWIYRDLDASGSWSINMWKPGEEPTMN